MKVFETLFNVCSALNISEFGATSALPFYEIDNSLSSFSIFCNTGANRINPLITMNEAKSIICALFPYKQAGLPDTPKPPAGKIVSGDVHFGQDYHFYVKKKLNHIADALKRVHGGRYLCFCDTGPLVDKAVAVRCGLCAYGRNSLAINEKHGSMFFIGYILTNMLIENTKHEPPALFKGCSHCEACIKACPSAALFFNVDKCGMNYTRCLSYITQKKGSLTKEESQLINTLYGCHICQHVCPANRINGAYKYERYVNVGHLNSLSNRQFLREFSDTAAGWVGKNIFLRNALSIK